MYAWSCAWLCVCVVACLAAIGGWRKGAITDPTEDCECIVYAASIRPVPMVAQAWARAHSSLKQRQQLSQVGVRLRIVAHHQPQSSDLGIAVMLLGTPRIYCGLNLAGLVLELERIPDDGLGRVGLVY